MPLVAKIVKNSTTQLFNQAVMGVLTQNKQCKGMSMGCQYRIYKDDEVTLACAVGHLITDEVIEEYKKDNFMELRGSVMGNMSVREALAESIGRHLSTSDLVLFQCLQDIHDTCDTTPDEPMVRFSKEILKLAELKVFH